MGRHLRTGDLAIRPWGMRRKPRRLPPRSGGPRFLEEEPTPRTVLTELGLHGPFQYLQIVADLGDDVGVRPAVSCELDGHVISLGAFPVPDEFIASTITQSAAMKLDGEAPHEIRQTLMDWARNALETTGAESWLAESWIASCQRLAAYTTGDV